MALRANDWISSADDQPWEPNACGESSLDDKFFNPTAATAGRQTGQRVAAPHRFSFSRLGIPPGSVHVTAAANPPAQPIRPGGTPFNRSPAGVVGHMVAARQVAREDAAIADIRRGVANSESRSTLLEMERNYARTGRVEPPSQSPPGSAGIPAFAGVGSVRRAQADKNQPAPFPYDKHQLELIGRDDRIVIGRAIAGAGKTTSAIGFAQARPDHSLLYLAFGASNAKEAKARFPANVTCSTIHSLAFQSLPQPARQRVTGFWRAADIAPALNVDVRTAANCSRVLAAFYCSTDRQIGMRHAAETVERWGLDEREARMAVEAARRAWMLMNEPGSRLPLVHDAYLKRWTLTSPVLRYDHIILDEAQDTNPITEELVKSQLGHAKLLAIGDPHQSIYAFRGATNAMENLSALPGARQVTMPRTWRFGARTADFANTLLSSMKGETIPIEGMGSDGPWDDGHFTMLARTNGELFLSAAERNGEGIHWMGGIEKYAINLIEDAYRIYNRDVGSVKDAFLRKFRTWPQLTEYAENARDAEIQRLIKCVETYKHDTPVVIDKVRDNAEPTERNAQMVLTTAHKAKGLEWNCVRIAQDFEFLFDAEEELRELPPGERLSTPTEQEVNLLYVAATRAKKCVQLNNETKLWLKELPKLEALRDEAFAAAAPGAPGRLRA